MVTQLNDGSTKPFMCVCGNIDTSAICVLAQFIGETTNSKIFRRTLASQYWHHILSPTSITGIPSAVLVLLTEAGIKVV